MTYKNFALDHFLEACLDIPKIVRIGSAENEKLSSINLRKVSSFLDKNGLKHTFHIVFKFKLFSYIKSIHSCYPSQTFNYFQGKVSDIETYSYTV